jgi:hypothetical protein
MTMKLIDGFWSDLDAYADRRELALLAALKEYRIPGYVRQPGDPLDPYGDVSCRLIDMGLANCGPEPLGTFTDGREDYGTVYRITDAGLEELGCWE